MLCFSRAIQVKFLITRIRYHVLTKFAHVVPYYGHTMVQFMTFMESFYIMVFFSLACYHTPLSNFPWLSRFHRLPYMTFYDFHVFYMEVNPGNERLYVHFYWVFEKEKKKNCSRQFSQLTIDISEIFSLPSLLILKQLWSFNVLFTMAQT